MVPAAAGGAGRGGRETCRAVPTISRAPRREAAGSPDGSLERGRHTVNSLKRWVPGLQVLSEYQAAWFPHDLVAGLVLTAMLVPVGIAYAIASGVPGIYGLYATIVPLLA